MNNPSSAKPEQRLEKAIHAFAGKVYLSASKHSCYLQKDTDTLIAAIQQLVEQSLGGKLRMHHLPPEQIRDNLRRVGLLK